jgi:HK97 family phage prohead protease
MEKYDFSGWATKANLKCSDGRIILKDAFKHNDGETVPLVWNHQHNDPNEVLGHALLENRDEGVYAYCTFNETESGQTAKLLVQHGDVSALSIYANKLKQTGSHVTHGAIREVSLVLAGANPGAFIDSVMVHGEESDEEAVIYTGEEIDLYHADSDEDKIEHAEKDNEEKPKEEPTEEKKPDNEKSVKEVLETLNEEQRTAVAYVIGTIIDDEETDDKTDGEGDDVKHNDENNDLEGGNETMKRNVFDKEDTMENAVLSHADEEKIIAMAKTSGVGSLQDAISIYMKDNESLAHGIDQIETLFPEFKNLNPGAPELIRQDQSWVMRVINKIHKSPYSRIRTRQADARIAELRAKGYQKKGDQKTLSANIKLLGRTTDPQTVYRKDMLNRDDIVDITDFDVVNYQWGIMKDNMYEELALAALVGDGRDDGDPDKIHETHIRSIWNDEELYTIHKDVDVDAMKEQLQGTNTGANFGENFIYAEAMITAALYAREQFKGSGTPDYYCAPHSVNVMLLARDLNGRRIYDSKADLAKALNVGEIIEIEQLEGRTRTTATGETKKLHGIFVNLNDYTFGSTKGGEITKFEDFDIDFNQYKYLMEARLSGSLTKVFSAIALEEPAEAAGE